MNPIKLIKQAYISQFDSQWATIFASWSIWRVMWWYSLLKNLEISWKIIAICQGIVVCPLDDCIAIKLSPFMISVLRPASITARTPSLNTVILQLECYSLHNMPLPPWWICLSNPWWWILPLLNCVRGIRRN